MRAHTTRRRFREAERRGHAPLLYTCPRQQQANVDLELFSFAEFKVLFSAVHATDILHTPCLLRSLRGSGCQCLFAASLFLSPTTHCSLRSPPNTPLPTLPLLSPLPSKPPPPPSPQIIEEPSHPSLPSSLWSIPLDEARNQAQLIRPVSGVEGLRPPAHGAVGLA